MGGLIEFIEEKRKSLGYFISCAWPFNKLSREKRLESIGHCNFWFTTHGFEEKYKDLSVDCCPLIKRKMKYAAHLYKEFEDEFGNKEHDRYCVYITKKTQIERYREGIAKLGNTLHAICHMPFELIQYRTVGFQMKENNIDLSETECEDISEDDVNRAKTILTQEQFRRHYSEIDCLRGTILGEISLRREETNRLKGWMLVFVSWLITVSAYLIDKQQGLRLTTVTLILILVPLTALFYTLLEHINSSNKLNEAKDVMYVCTGVDIDDPREISIHTHE